MASGPSVVVAKSILDCYIGGIAPTIIPPAVDVRLWTVAPDFTAAGGTEVTGGAYVPALLSVGAAVDGGVGQLAQILNDAAFTFYDMPVASTAVVAASLHNNIDDTMLWLNDSWSSPNPWAIGESPQFGIGDFFTDLIPV